MAEKSHKSSSSEIEPVAIGVSALLVAAIAALVVWQGFHRPDIARLVLLGGAGIHAVLALLSIREIVAELNTHPSSTDLRNFGLIFLAGTAILGVVFWQVFDAGSLDRARYFFIAGGAVLLLSFIPPVGRLLHIAWMAFGLTIGLVTAPLIMFLLYILLIVPVGLFFKITGRDLMNRKLDSKSESYWEDYPQAEDPSRYVKQF